MKHIIILLTTIFLSLPAFADQLILPNPTITPGSINPNATKEVICVRGYTSGNDADGEPVRNVSDATKRKVFQLYNIDPNSDKFEVDHLISLQLGGSNNITNLWPESYTTKPLNARTKDGLENRLHALVCKGTISLQTAQHEISTNWIEAYKKYFGVLPK